jgi:hypothetical protein
MVGVSSRERDHRKPAYRGDGQHIKCYRMGGET